MKPANYIHHIEDQDISIRPTHRAYPHRLPERGQLAAAGPWPSSPALSGRWARARGVSQPGFRFRPVADLVHLYRKVSRPGGAQCHE